MPANQSHTTPHITPYVWTNGPSVDQSQTSLMGRELEFYSEAGIDLDRCAIRRNLPPAKLYEEALHNEGAVLSATGALINYSGIKTGRSPGDKRIVYEETSRNDIWWGPVNIKMDEHSFEINRERAIDYLNTRGDIYVFDGFAGWDPKYRIKVRVICARAYHALFMRNMLIRPTADELRDFGEPDFIIYNAGQFPANRFTNGMTSQTSVSINFKRMEMVILGTEYAGEMKKGVFSVMHYVQPAKFGQLSIHAAANVGIESEDVTLFFGLSGTGKTTLSADPKRQLIGDDEHVWSDDGVFNIEGGCYAKCANLSPSKEPQIYDAVRFGTVLENVVYDPEERYPDFDDTSITENTRAAYPIDFIPNARIPCMTSSHPKNIIMLTCDAYGILPPVSSLSPEQASYHFLAGYTSKTPGTEEGIMDPIPTFSTCYSAPFITLHPIRYASMLADKMRKHKTACWLINTGWVGGKYGTGSRIPLGHTRAIIDAIHGGALVSPFTSGQPEELSGWHNYDVFNLTIPTAVPGVPNQVLDPSKAWDDEDAFERERVKLARLFNRAFRMFEHDASDEVKAAGPTI
ncbi:ATP-utilizing phosphoenolpyruvate carboxykinase [Cantharellus anzutake]|uniref:ATP-utilizing phosphoenolpyruvate carboxykinase n=1 Tax=Cantharellus anzutake TaxID=1750568 RepID=UPI00190367E4|nr:ATP-utilizing phosphoenolpyruvate carboxykinase [Cantharellus anzutake]KAF8332618.1 ATP-utilizing phosphoenolpyruvate carboxykinase [Cantharellus anzutake]